MVRGYHAGSAVTISLLTSRFSLQVDAVDLLPTSQTNCHSERGLAVSRQRPPGRRAGRLPHKVGLVPPGLWGSRLGYRAAGVPILSL